MKPAVLLFAVALSFGCGTMSNPATPAAPPAVNDLRWIDTLRELDEMADGVVGAAKFQSSSKELGAFADEASHAHRKRSEEIKEWRASSFATAAQNVALPPCAQAGFRVASKATDVEIVDALIGHRECASMYANDALINVRSTSARHVLEETARTFEAELKQLRAWRAQWQ